MRMAKGFLFVLIGLFIVITLFSLLIPARVVVIRAATVHADSLKIFEEISDLRNWKNWHPAFKNESAGITFSPTTDKVNSYADWVTKSKKNRLIITDKQYPYVKVLLQREGENDVSNMLSLLPVQERGNMQVQWESFIKLKWYPWEKFGGIFIEKMAGPGQEASLQSLKQIMESH